MKCNKLEQVGTKEYCKMLKRIQVLEDGRVLAKEARHWNIEGQKRRTTRKEYQRLLNKFEMEGFMAHKGLWNLAEVICCRIEESGLREKVMSLESIRPCMKKTS